MAAETARVALTRTRDVTPVCPPFHHDTESWPLVARGQSPLAESFELSVAEVQPTGRIDEHVHPDADHAYLVLAGCATAVVDGESFSLSEGTCLFIGRGAAHAMRVEGDSPVRFAVLWAPARSVENRAAGAFGTAGERP